MQFLMQKSILTSNSNLGVFGAFFSPDDIKRTQMHFYHSHSLFFSDNYLFMLISNNALRVSGI